MSTVVLERLLGQVSSLRRTQQKLALLSGENFNVFRILGMESQELKHSAFLGELLYPAGSHGLQDTFLKLFIETINHKYPAEAEKFSAFNTATARLVVEKHIGQITANNQQGGRIDIYLESAGEYIFIENKIYAGDQPNQLARYNAHRPSARLLYLTLHGNGPTEWSTGGALKTDQYQTISYKDDIIDWLEKCRQTASAYPLVRETIVQYINLIKQLTGSAPDTLMKEETKLLLCRDPEIFESALYCKTVLEELLPQMQQDLLTDLRAALEPKLVYPVGDYLQYFIRFEVWLDKDGYYYALRLVTDTGESAPAEASKALAQKAHSINSEFKTNSYYFAWSFFKDTGAGNIPPKRLFELQDKANRTNLINKMVSEATDILNRFLSLVKELN